MKSFNYYNKFIFFILSFILILILIYGNARHDYYLYTFTWESLVNNKKEIPYNSYGPIHLLLHIIYKINILAPKLLFGILFILMNFYIFKKILKKQNYILIIYFYLTTYCNFLIISFVFFYGVNDSIVSIFFIFSIIFFKKKKIISSSLFISIAMLIKLYPILFIPQYLFQKKKMALKMFLSTVFFISIFLLFFVIKYNYTLLLEPITFGTNRVPKFASIIASLNYSFPENIFVNYLINYNFYVVVIAVLSAHIFTLIKKTDILYSIVLVYVVMLITYKVGHPQFYIPLLVISSYLLSVEKRYLLIFKTLLPITSLLSLTSLGYSLTAGYDLMGNSDNLLWSNIRENIGYIYFATNFYTIIKLLLISNRYSLN